MKNISTHLPDITVKRKELKYYIPFNDYVILSNSLRRYLKQDKHNKSNKKGYLVRSLYFDTLENKSYEQKVAGIENRKKYRIRIYGINSDWAKFEIKSKFNDFILKESAVISREDAVKIQNKNYEVMLKYKDQILNKAYKEFMKNYYHPVVLVEYLREAFNYDVNDIRIVFDRFLKSTSLQLDIFDEDVFALQKLHKGLAIMELKYHNFIPEWLKKILHIPSFERSAISKYCIGRLEHHFQLA